MANVFVRSPYYINAQNSQAIGGYAILTISTSGTVRYTIKKNTSSNGAVLYEISELLRDYLDQVLYSENGGYGVFSHSITYNTVLQFYNSSGNSDGSAVAQSGFCIDAYGYYMEGYNPSTTRGLMQSNNIIYRLRNSDCTIPIDINNATKLVWLNNGEIIETRSIPNNSWVFSYYSNRLYGADSFKERIQIAGGTYEDNQCIYKFLDTNELFDVDEVRVETTDGLKILKVITLEECRYKPVKLTFFNRWGAQQDLWFFRKSVESLSSSKEEFKRTEINPAGYYNVLKHPRSIFNVKTKRKITINTGYVDESYNELMQEVMQSEKVWIEQDTIVRPVIVTSNSLTFKTSVNDKLVDYSLELDYAYDEIQNIR